MSTCVQGPGGPAAADHPGAGLQPTPWVNGSEVLKRANSVGERKVPGCRIRGLS